MALLALSYPAISEADRAWIQAIRAECDSQYEIVAPHFTLLFPAFDHQPEALSAHLHAQLQGQPPIAITMACALVVKDQFSPSTHTFLVPDQGFGALVKLHDRLYSGDLAAHLRLDIPFIPHITVASSLDPQFCKRIADEINRQNPAISGVVEHIDLVSFVDNKVTTLEQIALG